MNEVYLIGGMFAVTFSVRYILFAMAGKVKFPPWLNRALEFVPPVVLMAIIAPNITMPKGELWLSPFNPWLIASAIAIITALIRKDLLTTIVVGMLAFAGLRFGLGM
ncbi:MAG: AzlD domain-containing protein [Pseudomonadales bacterium]|nr:AzlD domain-containing protein [Pseudomonadales bacterium]NRA17457.1 AzlD domain-containing protein [Oceanospirillaceae bacterium]